MKYDNVFPMDFARVDGDTHVVETRPGLTKLELFSALILAGSMSDPSVDCSLDLLVRNSVDTAGLLIKALEAK